MKPRALGHKPLVCAIVCTYNRAPFLERTLESLARQKFPAGSFEIIVVDNASTDATKEVVERWRARDSRIRYIYESRLGVAFARNTGARAAGAPYIAYFDDDLLAEPDCLRHLISPFLKTRPAPAAVMGKVDLLWEGKRPAWFPQNRESLLSRFDQGAKPRFMRPDEYLITMNVAFHRKIFLRAGGIREDLSRKGRMLLCSGDNDIYHRYMQRHLPVFYQPKARVRHLVQRHRQTRVWLFKRVFSQGSSQTVMNYAALPTAQLMRRTVYDAKQALSSLWTLLAKCFQRRTEDRQEALLVLLRQLGKISAEFQLLAGIRNIRTFSE